MVRSQRSNENEAAAPVTAQGATVARSTGDGKSNLSRFEELEAYRGVAAVLIVVFHVYQYSREGQELDQYVYEGTPLHLFFSNLDVTVAWFFVLSGFLIFLPFVIAAINAEDPQSARGFLIRRAIRIVPLYYVAILIVWTLRYTGAKEQWVDLFEHLTFTQVFSQKYIFWTIGPAWSLSVEVIFYLFVAALGPIAYSVCRRISTRRARAVLLTGAVLALGITSVLYKWWAFYLADIPEDNWPVYFGPLAKLDTFAIGMLLAIGVVASKNRPLMRGILPSLLRLSGLMLLAVVFLFRLSSAAVELYVHTLAGLAFVLVLASTVLGPRKSSWERMLVHPTFQFLGLISYSVYIWHEPLMLELSKYSVLVSTAPSAFPLNTLVLLSVSIVVATFSYWLVERPATYLRYLFTKEGRLVQRYNQR